MAGISKAEREARAAAAAAAGQGGEGASGDGAGDQLPEAGGESVALVRMTRGDEHPAPHEADVHPDEVANYATGGWTVAS